MHCNYLLMCSRPAYRTSTPSNFFATGSAAAEVEPDEAVVAALIQMGFSAEGCRRACVATRNGLEQAQLWVLEHMGDADFDTPLPPRPSIKRGADDDTGDAGKGGEGECGRMGYD